MKFIFLHADKHESYLQIDDFWRGWSSIPKVSKFVMSLPYLKKEVRDEVDFLHADKHQSFLQGDNLIIDGHDQSFYKLALLFLVELTRYVQSTQKRKLVIFLKYLKKKMLQLQH